ncbi:MAG TPA: hypothetical protein PK490_13620, partial [Prosthecobacter sp.]|nr:hypothetical protein [Prosthecobacter sp.]
TAELTMASTKLKIAGRDGGNAELGVATGAADDFAGHFRLGLQLHVTRRALEFHNRFSLGLGWCGWV